MALVLLDVTPNDAAPAPRVARFLADANGRLDDLVRDGLHERLPSFAPAAYDRVHGVLSALARTSLRGERFLEWGSAVGAVAGMASALGFRAAGIEIDEELVELSRDLLATHAIDVEIVHGSFVPVGHEVPAELDDPDTDTLQHGIDAYDLLGRELEEFGIVYAYPWPDMRDAFLDIFDAHAAVGAVLITYDGRGEVSVHRKV